MKSEREVYIVEDDDMIRELLEINLRKNGYTPKGFFSAENLLEEKNINQRAVFILDLNLPGINGISLAETLAERGILAPILFLTAMPREQFESKALSAGAIDYIEKPFEINTLLYKIRNLFSLFNGESLSLPKRIGSVSVDWDLGIVTLDGKAVQLSEKEEAVLRALVSAPKKIMPREVLMRDIHQDELHLSSRYLDNIIVKLRKLFEEDPANPKTFLTHPRRGYSYCPATTNKEIQ